MKSRWNVYSKKKKRRRRRRKMKKDIKVTYFASNKNNSHTGAGAT
jgi:hypothetical protein